MITSVSAFNVDLYEEHLEEASFLYEQRNALLGDPKIPWSDIAPFEARLEAHIDALVVGADAATEVCRRRVIEGDAGELFAAGCVACRHENAGWLAEMLRCLDYSNNRNLTAIADSLKLGLPVAWHALVEEALGRQDVRLLPALASVIGYRRLPMTGAVQTALTAHPEFAGSLVDALGRLADRGAIRAVERHLQHPEPDVRASALVALLRIGVEDPLRHCYLVAHKEDWPHLALGLGGDRSACNVFLPLATSARATSNCLLALGLLGSTTSLRVLHESLGNPSVADSAALALHWITGAPLFEQVFIPEPPDEDEQVGDELEAWRRPRWKLNPTTERPRGETVRKLSVDLETWRLWFVQNGSHFDPKLRYRSGQPYGPDVLMGNLTDEPGDRLLRKLAAQELAIRYGCDVPFESDMPVAHQREALQDIGRWIEGNAHRFQRGGWYFAGRSQ